MSLSSKLRIKLFFSMIILDAYLPGAFSPDIPKGTYGDLITAISCSLF